MLWVTHFNLIGIRFGIIGMLGILGIRCKRGIFSMLRILRILCMRGKHDQSKLYIYSEWAGEFRFD